MGVEIRKEQFVGMTWNFGITVEFYDQSRNINKVKLMLREPLNNLTARHRFSMQQEMAKFIE